MDSTNSLFTVLMTMLGVYIAVEWLCHLRPHLAAEKAFRQMHPDTDIAWSSVRANEVGRWIVGVYYGHGKPPSYEFYSVSKDSHIAQKLEDDSAYRPKVWR